MKKVVEIYQRLLPFLGLFVDDKYIINVGGGELGKIKDLKIGDKQVYLPVDETLKNAEYRGMVGFHPMAENILKKRSPMLTAVQHSLEVRLTSVFILLMESLLGAAAAQKTNNLKVTSPDLLAMLVGHENVTNDTIHFFKELCNACADGNYSLITVYLKHGGQIRGEKVDRICSVQSPLLDALENAQIKATAKSGPISVWGITPKRKMDIALLARVIKTIFPLFETDGYSSGSTNTIIPYCDALFQSLRVINDDIHRAVKPLCHVEPCKTAVDYILADDEVLDQLDEAEYDVLRNSIILIEGNDGDGFINETRDVLVDKSLANESRKETRKPVSAETSEPTIAEQVVHTVNQITRQPGTRQPLINITEEEYRTVPLRKPQGGFKKDDGRYPRTGFHKPEDLERMDAAELRRRQAAEDRLEELERERRRLEREVGGSSSRSRYPERSTRRYRDDDYDDYDDRRSSPRARPRVGNDRRDRRDDSYQDRFGRREERRPSRFGRR